MSKLDDYKKELREKIEKLKIGGQFSIQSIIKENGYNRALRDVLALLEDDWNEK